MENKWRIADKLVEKFNESSSDIEEFEDFDDFAIKNLPEKPFDELLTEHGKTKKQALSEIKSEHKFYDELADKLKIKPREFPHLWIELIKQCENETTEDNIKLLLWLTAGGKFTAKEADKLSIRQWLGVKKRKNELENFFENLHDNIPKFAEILENIDLIKTVKLGKANESDTNRVFSVICNNAFAEKCDNTEMLRENLTVISELIDNYEFLKPIKPLVYFQVYVRQTKKLLNGEFFIPNLKSVFKYREYNIFDNNEKNFDQYAECCRLYILLKSCFPDADEKLCDTGFLYSSNLAAWHYELGYMNYKSEIPDGIPLTSYAMIREMTVFCFEDPVYEDNVEELENRRKKYPNLYYEIINAVEDIRFEELGEFAELGERFCDKFFNKELKKYIKNENQHEAAWGLLVCETERRFDELLEQKICDILDKYYCYS